MNHARQNQWSRRGAEWRDLAWAVAGAAAVALLLAVAVAVVWSIGRAPSRAPAVSQAISSTPTPRALVFGQDTPTPLTETAAAVTPAVPTPVATQQLLVVSASSSSGTAARGPIFEASSGTDFSRLASGSWRASDDWLVNDGSDPVAQPWLRFSSVPEAAFAVEAEIRVENVLASVCDQSFGLAAGTPGTSAVYGAGVFFPCGGAPPVARLSDVSVWEDGYNADPVFAEDSFDPGQDWHTYRFEVRGDQIRLIVDGVGIVSAAAPAALEPGASGAETGIWSQGAAVDVRRATIHPLPPR